MDALAAPLVLRCFGDCHLGAPSGGPSFGRGKPYALVAYLACMPGFAASRDELITLLWSNVGAEEGRHALRHTMWSVRRRLGDDVIAGEGATVRLGRAIDADRDRFVAAAERRALADAVQVYAGEFLPGLALPGGDEFERWADLERARLRAMFLRAADGHARALLGAGKYREAQQLARRAVDADPLGQAPRRLILDVLIASSDSLSAAAEADAIEHFFAAEEIDLDTPTRAAIAAARAPRADVPTAEQRAGFSTDLVGREREFALLIDRWNDARAGHFSHVHLIGAAGLGKSRLLDDFAARLRSRRSRLALVRGKSGERHLPFALAADLAESLARMPGAAGIAADAAGSLVAMHPSLSTVFPTAVPDAATGGDAVRRRAFALADLARAVADDAPLAILVDDLHWADAASKQVISAFLSRLDGVRGMAVTTARPSEDVVLQRDPGDTLRLEPLQAAAIADLLASIGTLPDDDWAATLPALLRQATGGLPLHVIETLQLALDRGTLVLGDRMWQCTDRVALRELLVEGSGLERRLRALRGDELGVVTLLALAGVGFTAAGVARAIGAADADVEDRLAALERRGVVRRIGDAWRVAHDEIADAAIAIASGADLRDAHRRIGEHFAALDSQHRALAVEHLLAAGERTSIADLFRHELGAARRRGDWRSSRDVARDFLGATASDVLVGELAAAIPLGLRRRWRVGWFGAAAVVALAVFGAGAAYVLRAPPPDSWLEAMERRGSQLLVARAPISDATFRLGASIGFAAPTAITGLDSAGDAIYAVRFAIRLPDGRMMYHRTTRDSGGTDIFIRAADRTEERVTSSPGDDTELAISPDGRYVVIATQRWNAREHNDLAIYDVRRRTLRRLTTTDANEGAAQWSPGGGLLAFSRQHFDGRPPDVCIIGFDGTDERCGTSPGLGPASPVGWSTASEVMVQASTDTGAALVALDPDLWSYKPVHEGASMYVVSPSGAYFAARVVSDSSEAHWVVGATRARGLVREIGRLPTQATVRFAPGARGVRYLERVTIARPSGAVDPRHEVQLRVDGRDQAGDAFPPGPLRWTTLDPAVATVSQAGVVFPEHAGVARIIASAHGWRADTVTVEVAGPADPSVRAASQAYALEFASDWQTMEPSRWVPFGVPRPSLARSDRGPVLSTNGDSTFNSGVYSAAAIPVRRGVGARTYASVDLNWIQWQIVELELALTDRAALPSWDHVTGALPEAPSGQSCSVGAPNGEGTIEAQRGFANALGANRAFLLTPEQRRGGWIRLDIQILPDGRCAMAVDGRPIWISPSVFSPSDSITVILHGKAYHSHSWFGATEVWTGVRGDINWEPLLTRTR